MQSFLNNPGCLSSYTTLEWTDGDATNRTIPITIKADNDPEGAESFQGILFGEVIGELNEDAKVIVSQINSALHRIDTEEYGICMECGIDISKDRLDAVPYATLCIECAEKAD